MKFLLIIYMMLMGSFQDETLKDIGTALKTGSSRELIQFCNQTVEIKIKGKGSNYSKSQAEIVLRNFFKNNPPSNFNYIHQGASPEGLKYTIGKYSYDQGAYRVVMLVKKINDKYLIDTLTFSEE